MVASNIEFTANATIEQFEITIEINSNGNITPSTNQPINYGDRLELLIEAEYGYKLVQLLDDGVDVSSQVVDNKYTISNVTKNHIISATFDLITYIIIYGK